jgi:hypothetical protein
MSDTVLPAIKEAFEHADGCYMEVNGIIDNLENALDMLPESDTEIRTAITHIMDKAFALMDTCSALSKDLYDLRLKYRASYMPSQVSPEVDELVEVLARIEARRQRTKPEQS